MIVFPAICPIEPHSPLAAAFPGHTVYMETDQYGLRTFVDEASAHDWVDKTFPVPHPVKPIDQLLDAEDRAFYRGNGFHFFVDVVAPNNPRVYFATWRAARWFAAFDAKYRSEWLVSTYRDTELAR